MNKKEVLKRLGNLPDAFEDFVPIPNTKLIGWNGDLPIFGELIKEIKPKLIIEVGSWYGQSSANMANALKMLGLEDSVLICVDTWLGSSDHWLDPNLRELLEFKNGMPTFYNRFLTNMINAEVQDWVVPFPLPSSIAATILKESKLKAELVYLDGSHECSDVYNDLLNYWDLLELNGYLLMDDADWSGPMDAVKAFSAEKGITYRIIGTKCLLHKSK